MIIAISGTPGVGKSSVANELENSGYKVIRLDDLAGEKGFFEGEEDGSKLVNVDKLNKHVKTLKAKNNLFLVSHYSHQIDHDAAVVLRCHPEELKKRLKKRSWTDAKIRENLEAEAIDVITIEALENSNSVYEIDATELNPTLAVKKILQILKDKDYAEKFKPGKINWSEVVMKWY